MNVEAIGRIRDTRGLTTNEKMFLYTVASHKDGMFKTHDKNYTDMSMSKATYYRVRNELINKDLLMTTRRMDNSTVYMINDQGLANWQKSHTETFSVTQNEGKSHTETSQSHSETPESQRETIESHCAETKDNPKSNLKNNLEEEPNESAGASSFPIDKNEEDKEEQETPASPIGLNDPAPARLPMEVTISPESHSETTFKAPWEIELEQREARLAAEGLL